MLRIYKSSAGSGKTYTLVKEYLRLALTPPTGTKQKGETKYRNILAITFTNKAAAEMKSRIIEALEELAKGGMKQLCEELCALTGKEETQLRADAALVLRSMLHNYSDISVSTIDSFVHRIVRSFAYDLHLPMNFDIEMDSKKLLHDAVQLLLDRLSESDAQITQAVLEFAETKIEDGQSWNIDYEIQKLGRELFVDDAMPFIQQLSLLEFDKLREAKGALHAKMKGFEKDVLDEGKKAFDAIMTNGLTASDFFQGVRGVFGYYAKMAEGEFPKDVTGNTYVRACLDENNWGKKDKLGEGIKEQLRGHYQTILHLWQTEGKDYFLADLMLRNFYAFILLADLQKLMEEIKRDENILYIGDFHHKVFEIVKEQDAPIIYERIGEKYDNILIDEFQDTSVIQWRNLLPLIENSQFKSEDSLIVGDGKQAIYRFRGGEVEQFAVLPKIYGSEGNELLKQREVAVNNYGAEVEILESNFRSSEAVIDFNNALYRQMLELPELKNKNIYADYFQKQGKEKPGGFVSIEFLRGEEENDKSMDDVRNERVEQIIAELLQRGYNWSDIAILTRSNLNASTIASYLVQKEIRVISPESLLINQSQKVQLLLAIFNYLSRKDDHIARAEMLHYTQLLHGKLAQFEQVDFKVPSVEFEAEFRLQTQIEFDSTQLTIGRLADLTQQLIRVFTLSDDDPFLQFFLDEVLLYTSRYGNSISEFLGWWDGVKHKKSIIYPDSLNAVRIMTIHKSKGLQFPVVILADAVEEKKMTKSFFWVPLNKPYLPQMNIGLLPRNKQVLQTEFAALYEKEDEQSFLDLLNLLYVGTTRPEDALYILSEHLDKEPVENNSVTALLIAFLRGVQQWEDFQQYVFGDLDFTKAIPKKEKVEKFEMYSKGQTQSAMLLASAIKVKMRAEKLWSESTTGSIDEGNLLHEALKLVKYEGDEVFVAHSMKAGGLVNDAEEIELLEKLKSVVYNPGINLLFKRDCRVITERALLKQNEKLRIPDRVVLKNAEAFIIDYKTGEPNTQHHYQVKEYGRWLEEAGIKVKEKIIFYTAAQRKEVVA
ncbi:MAG: UvrD-helicase domain-containing protein [Chitinophagales bacterium]|nr:UvrD-helicase domain-containing protein [Chitinophagales bacterium]